MEFENIGQYLTENYEEPTGMDNTPDDFDEEYADIDRLVADEVRDGNFRGHVNNYADGENTTVTWSIDFSDGETPSDDELEEIADSIENGAATGVTSMSDIVWNLNFLGADEINESLKILTLCEGWSGMKSYPTPADFESIVNQYIDDAVGEYEADTPSVDYEADEEEVARQEELQDRYREKLEQIKREIWNEIKYDVKAAEDIAYKIDQMLADKLGIRSSTPDWIHRDLKESDGDNFTSVIEPIFVEVDDDTLRNYRFRPNKEFTLGSSYHGDLSFESIDSDGEVTNPVVFFRNKELSQEEAYNHAIEILGENGFVTTTPINESKLSVSDKKKLHPKTFGAKYNGEEHFPLNDEEHVRSAISYFHKCPRDKQKSLAQKIVKAAKKFGVEVSEKSKVMKALNEAFDVKYSDSDFPIIDNATSALKKLLTTKHTKTVHPNNYNGKNSILKWIDSIEAMKSQYNTKDEI